MARKGTKERKRALPCKIYPGSEIRDKEKTINHARCTIEKRETCSTFQETGALPAELQSE
jgi:hypothetical protein